MSATAEEGDETSEGGEHAAVPTLLILLDLPTRLLRESVVALLHVVLVLRKVELEHLLEGEDGVESTPLEILLALLGRVVVAELETFAKGADGHVIAHLSVVGIHEETVRERIGAGVALVRLEVEERSETRRELEVLELLVHLVDVRDQSCPGHLALELGRLVRDDLTLLHRTTEVHLGFPQMEDEGGGISLHVERAIGDADVVEERDLTTLLEIGHVVSPESTPESPLVLLIEPLWFTRGNMNPNSPD